MMRINRLLFFILFFAVHLYFIYSFLFINEIPSDEFISSFFLNIQKLGTITTLFLVIFEYNNWIPFITPIYASRLKDTVFTYILEDSLIKSLIFTSLYLIIFTFYSIITRDYFIFKTIVILICSIYFSYSFFYFSLSKLLYIILNNHTKSIVITGILFFITMAIIIELDYSPMIMDIGSISYIHILVLTILSFISIIFTKIALIKKDLL